MNAKKRKQNPIVEPENFEFSDVLQERNSDEVAALFSREFEQDLRRILGDQYQDRPKGKE